MVPSSLFKAYDIRGLSPGELGETGARRIGKALAKLHQPKRVVIGRDMRTTSQMLEDALIDGFVTSGVDVVRVGLCSTPMFNAAVGEADGAYDLGVMVTASHNPAMYNGFKMERGNCLPIGQGSGMEELRDLAASDEPILDARTRGTVTQDEGLLARYIDRICALAQLPPRFPDWRIVVDAGNGMDGLVLPMLSRRLPGMEVTQLYWDLDGTFPHHEANPLMVETLEDLRIRMRKEDAMFGAAFDGDGDRVGFVDEQGTPIPGDMLTALFAQELLRDRGAGKVLYDLRSSRSVPEAIIEAGGEPIMCRVGHAHIKKQMAETGAIFGGELSMHFYFSDLWNCESGDLAMLMLINILLREGKPLSQVWRPLLRYAHSGEINFSVRDAKQVMAALETHYGESPTDISHLDGLRMEFRYPLTPYEDWWFNVRPSNTEPLLRLNLEAKTSEQMEMRKAEVSALIQSVA